MKRILIVLSVLLLVTTGCGNNKEEEVGYQMIKADEVKEMIKTEGTYIVDVRTEEEYASGHIEGALNVPVDVIEARFSSVVTEDKEANIIVYCRSGVRAKEASEKLVRLGFKNVYDLGGLSDWPDGLVS